MGIVALMVVVVVVLMLLMIVVMIVVVLVLLMVMIVVVMMLVLMLRLFRGVLRPHLLQQLVGQGDLLDGRQSARRSAGPRGW